MEFNDVLRRRRMVRRFTDQPVSEVILQRLLRAAQRAPSAGHTQPLELIVVRDPGVRAGLSAASWSRGAGKYLYMDVAYAALLFMLSAVNEGLACGFVGDLHEEHVQAVLGLPPHVVPVGMVVLGYGDEPPRDRPWRPLTEIIHYDRYAPAYDWSSRSLPPGPRP
jgi:nitroreductase